MANRAEQLEQLTAYLDDALSPAECAKVERLIASDRKARQLLEQLQEISRLVSALPREQAPAGLADAVVSRMERRDLLGGDFRKSQKVKKSKHREIETTGAGVSAVAAWSRRFAVAASLALMCTAVWMAWSQWSGPNAELTQPVQLAEADKSRAQADKSTTGRAQGPSQQHEQISPGLAFAPSRASRSPNPAVPDAPRGVARPSSTPLALGYAGDGDEEQSPEAKGPAVSRADAAKTMMMKPVGKAERQIAALILPNREEPQPIVVETDGATVAKLTGLIRDDMSRHGIPMLDAKLYDKPTGGEEAFFTLQRAKPPSRSAGDSNVGQPPAYQSTNEVRIVIHARREVAGEILSSVRRISQETGTFGKKAKEKRKPAKRLEVNEATTTAKALDGEGSDDDHRAVLAKRQRGRFSRGRPTSQAGVAGKEPFVTLRIILRVKSSADSQAGASGTMTKPASQPAATPQW